MDCISANNYNLRRETLLKRKFAEQKSEALRLRSKPRPPTVGPVPKPKTGARKVRFEAKRNFDMYNQLCQRLDPESFELNPFKRPTAVQLKAYSIPPAAMATKCRPRKSH